MVGMEWLQTEAEGDTAPAINRYINAQVLVSKLHNPSSSRI